MAANLLDLMKNMLSGTVADQLGSAAGLNKQQTSSALDAVIPVLLGSVLKKASTPSGASDLSQMLRKQDTSMLDNLGGLLSGGGSSLEDMISMGTKLLPSLLGNSQGNVVGSLIKMLGIDQNTILKLLGMLAPIVMSFLGKQAKSMGALDPSALTSLLGSQASHLAKAIPSELQGAMGIANTLSSMEQTASKAVKAANPLQWLLPLAALAALAYLGYTFLFNKPIADSVPNIPNAATAVTDAAKSAANKASDIATGLTEGMQTNMTGMFDGISTTLKGITDEASARDAVGSLEKAAKDFAAMGLDKLAGAEQTAAKTFLSPILKGLLELLEKAYAIPGVKAIIEPVIGPMIQAAQAIGA